MNLLRNRSRLFRIRSFDLVNHALPRGFCLGWIATGHHHRVVEKCQSTHQRQTKPTANCQYYVKETVSHLLAPVTKTVFVISYSIVTMNQKIERFGLGGFKETPENVFVVGNIKKDLEVYSFELGTTSLVAEIAAFDEGLVHWAQYTSLQVLLWPSPKDKIVEYAQQISVALSRLFYTQVRSRWYN